MLSIITGADIERGLREAGVRPGAVVFFHSSLSALGYVVNGADAVIDAFLAAVGAAGTVVVPTFTLEGRSGEFGSWWDPATTPSTVGIVTEVFRKRPGARRSDHPSHSVAAIGAEAEEITRIHRGGGERLTPWEGAFSVGGPFDHLYAQNAVYLLLGTGFHVQTMGHYVETLLVEQCLARASALDSALAAGLRARVRQVFRGGGVWPILDLARMGERLLDMGVWRRARVGRAPVHVAATRPHVDAALKMVRSEPELWLNDDFLDWYSCVPGVALRRRTVRGVFPAGVTTPSATIGHQAELDTRPPAPPDGMARVPAGWFMMGSLGTDSQARADERPQRLVYLDEFFIDRHPVTNAEYERFVRATGNPAPVHWPRGRPPAGTEEKPVTFVDWPDATAYAAWAGKRLPREAEWEKAARGGLLLDGASAENPAPWRRYPWGDAFDAARCRSSQSPLFGLARVGESSPAGDSPYGVADLAGNVLEWVADWYAADYYENAPDRNPTGPVTGALRVLRGGAFGLSGAHARCACRCALRPDRAFGNHGFRCAWSPLPARPHRSGSDR